MEQPSPPSSLLLLEEHLIQLAEEMDASMIMTPQSQLRCIAVGDTVGSAVDLMEDTYDQLPVIADHRPIGLLVRDAVVALPHDSPIDGLFDQVDPRWTAFEACRIDMLIRQLAQEPCLLVVGRSGTTLKGLIHYSDLNRQAVRVFLYLWLSALEMGLSQLVRESGLGLNDWLQHLAEHRQVMVLGRYEYERRQRLELH